MKNIKGTTTKEYDKETASIVKAIKERHKEAIAQVQSERPAIKNFNAWLMSNGHKERPAPEEFSRARMVDLNEVMDMNDNWHRVTDRNDRDAVHYKNDNTGRHIIVRCDQTGSGVRWYEPEQKSGGSFDALAAELDLKAEQKQWLIESAPEPMGELCDHRQLTFKSALALWSKARKPTATSLDPQNLRETLGKKFDTDAKVVTRPYGEVTLIANRNAAGDIVAVEVIGDRFQTITRSSNDRAAQVVTQIAERNMQPLRKARQIDETAELKAALVALRKMDLTRPTAQLSDKELTQGRIAAAHFRKHEPTMTPTERLVLKEWSVHEKAIKQHEDEKARVAKRLADAAAMKEQIKVQRLVAAAAPIRTRTEETYTTPRGYGR